MGAGQVEGTRTAAAARRAAAGEAAAITTDAEMVSGWAAFQGGLVKSGCGIDIHVAVLQTVNKFIWFCGNALLK